MTGKRTPRAVLRVCLDHKWDNIIVIGTRKEDQNICYMASTYYSPELMWLLEKVRHHLLREAESQTERGR